MELAIALIIFAALIVMWFVLPGSVTVEETHTWAGAESMSIAPAKA
jgi:hypothetical protein